MLWRTHVLGGLASLWALEPIPQALTSETLLPLACAAALGALLPDLDAERSKIQSLSLFGVRPFLPLSTLLHRSLGHRGPLHSWAGLAAVSAIACPLGFWWGWGPSAALCLGFASHLALDACTPSGIPRSPTRRDRTRLHLLPAGLRVVTGSPWEDLFLCLLAGAVLWLLLRHAPGPSGQTLSEPALSSQSIFQ